MNELRSRRRDVYTVAERYGVSNIRVFGSVARAEADDVSDVDLLVDLAPGRVCSISADSSATPRRRLTSMST